jgi:hypothetical protein
MNLPYSSVLSTIDFSDTVAFEFFIDREYDGNIPERFLHLKPSSNPVEGTTLSDDDMA